jgi:hypothetical protein
MSEVYEEDHESYSPFWPLLVLIVGLLFWSGYQVYVAYIEKSNFDIELRNAGPAIAQAQKSEAQLFSLFQDLVQTSAKDANAAQIVKESHMQLKEPAGSTTDGSTPASSTP